MIRRALLLTLGLALIGCSNPEAQQASAVAASPRAFFGTTVDPNIGTDAWLISLDTSSALIPPLMAKVAILKLGPGETIEFQTESLFEKHCLFRGVLRATGLDGKVAVIEDDGSRRTLAEYPLTAAEIITSANTSAGLAVSGHYSNNDYSPDGGDLLGLDLEFFTTARGPVGIMVTYEGHWGLPTMSSLPLSEITKDGTTIRFGVKLHDQTMKFHLRPARGGVRLVREGDNDDSAPVVLKPSKSFLK